MRPGRIVALALGIVGAIALAVWMLPSALDTSTTDRDARAGQADSSKVEPARAATPSPKRPARASAADTVTPVWPNESTVIMPSYLVTQPRLADRVQPLLKRGTDIELAAQGFRTAEQFAAVAHAAHNLDVPFVVLKDRVLNQRMSLSKAIEAMRPDVNANEQASRAVAEARADVFEAGRAGAGPQ